MKSITLTFLVITTLTNFVFSQKSNGNKYLGLTPPGKVAEVFAPNLISTGLYEFGSVFNKDATEFYYAVNVNRKSEIRYSKLVGKKWTAPVTILDDGYGYNDPFLSPDETLLYYISRRPLDGAGDNKDYDIWYSEKTPDGWSDPINVGSKINTDKNEYYISFTKDGTMYFASNSNTPENRNNNFDIYSSKYVNGKFQKPVLASNEINTAHYEADVFIDPDESYIIFAANRPGGIGGGDLYISFKNADGSWTQSKNMGSVVNTTGDELCPFVSYDKKYFFYTSNGDIYWVSTEILEGLR